MSRNHQGRWFYSRGESPEREPLGVRVLIVGSGGAGSGPLRFCATEILLSTLREN